MAILKTYQERNLSWKNSSLVIHKGRDFFQEFFGEEFDATNFHNCAVDVKTISPEDLPLDFIKEFP